MSRWQRARSAYSTVDEVVLTCSQGVKRRMEGVVEHPDAKRGRMDALKAAARPAPRAPFKLPTEHTPVVACPQVHRMQSRPRSRLHSLTAAVCACKGHSHRHGELPSRLADRLLRFVLLRRSAGAGWLGRAARWRGRAAYGREPFPTRCRWRPRHRHRHQPRPAPARETAIRACMGMQLVQLCLPVSIKMTQSL